MPYGPSCPDCPNNYYGDVTLYKDLYIYGDMVMGHAMAMHYTYASYACTPPVRALWAVMPHYVR